MPAGTVVPADYVIGADDILTIVFWREKDLSSEVVVRPDGRISLPVLQDVHAAGLTPEQLRDSLTKTAERFVEDPNVTVIVKEINSRRVFITGQVAKPGPYNVTSPMTVVQLIAFAGGLLEYADAKNILVDAHGKFKSHELPLQLQGSARGKEPQAEYSAQARRHRHCSVRYWMSLLSLYAFRTIAMVIPALILPASGFGTGRTGGTASEPSTVDFDVRRIRHRRHRYSAEPGGRRPARRMSERGLRSRIKSGRRRSDFRRTVGPIRATTVPTTPFRRLRMTGAPSSLPISLRG